MRKLATELLGTFWLVFGGCGSAVIAAAFPDVGIGLLGVALADALLPSPNGPITGGIRPLGARR
jgi:aquaporin Z